MLLNVTGTPYYLSAGAGTSAIQSLLRELTERIELLRAHGNLTGSTLRDYHGEKRFEQIAESNALEGSRPTIERLAWAGVMGEALRARLSGEPGRPVLLWSIPNPKDIRCGRNPAMHRLEVSR